MAIKYVIVSIEPRSRFFDELNVQKVFVMENVSLFV